MIKIENIEVFNIDGAIRGMRNPLNSWDKSDSKWESNKNFVIGQNDIDLMRQLYRAGSSHRKYLRQIFVSMDITAPLYWWKEMDQYRINVTTNSCSTMHTIHKKKFELDDFSHEHLEGAGLSTLQGVIERLNQARDYYNGKYDDIQPDINKKDYWWEMIQLLPSSYNQRRTITMNYENVINIIKQRTGHKLDEWNKFCDILRDLPYIKEITTQN